MNNEEKRDEQIKELVALARDLERSVWMLGTYGDISALIQGLAVMSKEIAQALRPGGTRFSTEQCQRWVETIADAISAVGGIPLCKYNAGYVDNQIDGIKEEEYNPDSQAWDAKTKTRYLSEQ